MNLGWALRRLLAQQAQGNLREKMREAVQEGLAAPSAAPHGTEGAPSSCDVGMVFALGAESGGTEDLLAATFTTKGDGFIARQGLLAGRRVVVLRGRRP